MMMEMAFSLNEDERRSRRLTCVNFPANLNTEKTAIYHYYYVINRTVKTF